MHSGQFSLRRLPRESIKVQKGKEKSFLVCSRTRQNTTFGNLWLSRAVTAKKCTKLCIKPIAFCL